MDERSQSETSSSSLSLRSLSTPNSPDVLNTPDTERCVLFDDDIVEDALDIASHNSQFIMVIGGLGYIGSHTVLSVLHRIQALANEHFATRDRPMPAVHFRRLDYRNPCMRSVLASYASYKLGTKFSGFHPRSGSNESLPSYAYQSEILRVDSGNKSTEMIQSATIDDPSKPILRCESRIIGVIHFAAFKSVEESIRCPLKYYENNVCGLVDFLGLLQEFGIKNFVFSSSATVYGEGANAGIPLREELCVHHPETYHDDDGDQHHAIPGVLGLTSPYGRTKFMCEAILADIAKADPTWSITSLRYFNPVGCHESGLLGEDPRQKPSNLIPVIEAVLMGDKPVLEIFGTDWDTCDGTAVRDFIHVVDLARGHIAALAAAAAGKIGNSFRTFNLGTGKGHTVREVLKSIEEASCRTIPVREVGRRPGDVGFCVADVRRAEIELGWRAEKSLADCSVNVWNHCQT